MKIEKSALSKANHSLRQIIQLGRILNDFFSPRFLFTLVEFQLWPNVLLMIHAELEMSREDIAFLSLGLQGYGNMSFLKTKWVSAPSKVVHA